MPAHETNLLTKELEMYLQKQRDIDTGKPFHCLNPLHEDKHPSMSFDRKRDKVHCFACGADYNIFDIIGIDYGIADAKEAYKKTLGVFGTASESKSFSFTGSDLDLELSSLNQPADYLAARGIGMKTAGRFGVRFESEWRHPKAPDYTPASPRVIIPTGGGSYLARDIRPDNRIPPLQKKYIKSKVGKARFFGLENALLQGGCEKNEKIFIVEGEFDALSVEECGFSAAALGSAAYVRRFADEITGRIDDSKTLILMPDSDDAGRQAADKLLELLTKAGIACIKAPPLPEKLKDPNEFLVKDRQRFTKFLEDAYNSAPLTGTNPENAPASSASRLEAFLANFKDYPANYPTGIQSLDKSLSGGVPAGLCVIGAASSVGKTTLILQIADFMARFAEKPVLFFSLEMSRGELTAKSFSRISAQLKSAPPHAAQLKAAQSLSAADIYKNIKSGSLPPDIISEYKSFAGNLYIEEGEAGFTIEKIRETALYYQKALGKAPVIFIDYLQIIPAGAGYATDKQRTDHVVVELKRISRDLNTPVIAVSSFNRAGYNARVSMESFKESGAVEYSSDVLIGLQFANQGDVNFDLLKAKAQNPRRVELVVLKNRGGEAGMTIPLNYYAGVNFFDDI